MKEITERKVIEVKKYQAFDGKVFTSKTDCEVHEHEIEMRRRYLEALADMEHPATEDWTPLDGGEYMEYKQYRWYKPTTIDDIDVLNELFMKWEREDNFLTTEDIGKWVCVEGEDFLNLTGDFYLTKIEDSIKHIKEFLDMFGITGI